MMPALSTLSSTAQFSPGSYFLSYQISDLAGRVWEANGGRIAREDRFQLDQALGQRLASLEAQGGMRAVSSLQRLWDSIPYATSQTPYPRISTLAESVLGHID